MQIILSQAKDTSLGWIELRHKDCGSLLGSFSRSTIETGAGTFMLYCYTCGEHSAFLHGLTELKKQISGNTLAEPFEINFI